MVGTELLDLYLASDGVESEAGDDSEATTSGDGSVGDHSVGTGSSSASSPGMSTAALGAARSHAGGSGIGSGARVLRQSLSLWSIALANIRFR